MDKLRVQGFGPSVVYPSRIALFHKVKTKKELNKEQGEAIVKMFLDYIRKRDEIYNQTVKDSRPDLQSLQKKLAALDRSTTADMVKTLTAEQQARWQAIIGDPFVGELPRRVDLDFLKRKPATS